jgi:hypothetical protein
MSKLSEQIAVGGSADEAKQACRDAITGLGWKSEEEGGAIVAKPGMSATAWPSKLTIGVTDAGGSATVNIDGSIYGFGPVQKKHLKKRMEEFRAAVEGRSASGA